MSNPFPTSEAAFHALPDERAYTASHAAGTGEYASCPPGLCLASIRYARYALAPARVAVYEMYGHVGIVESQPGSPDRLELDLDRSLSPFARQPFALT